MVSRTKSFLSRVSIFGVLALGACVAEDEQTARFSEASSRELSSALMAVSMVDYATVVIPTLAAFDNVFAQSNCPEVSATGIIGNGCQIPGGARYDGSVEIGPVVAGPFASMTFRDFGRVGDDLQSIYLDGTVTFTQEGDGELRYDLDMRIESQAGFAADVYWAEAKMSAICRMQGEARASCTVRKGSSASVSNLGGFTIEGTQSVGISSEEDEAPSELDLTLQGAETMHLEYDAANGCVTYTIEGGEPLSLCN